MTENHPCDKVVILIVVRCQKGCNFVTKVKFHDKICNLAKCVILELNVVIIGHKVAVIQNLQ